VIEVPEKDVQSKELFLKQSSNRMQRGRSMKIQVNSFEILRRFLEGRHNGFQQQQHTSCSEILKGWTAWQRVNKAINTRGWNLGIKQVERFQGNLMKQFEKVGYSLGRRFDESQMNDRRGGKTFTSAVATSSVILPNKDKLVNLEQANRFLTLRPPNRIYLRQ
jgi:hypothetical protein